MVLKANVYGTQECIHVCAWRCQLEQIKKHKSQIPILYPVLAGKVCNLAQICDFLHNFTKKHNHKSQITKCIQLNFVFCDLQFVICVK